MNILAGENLPLNINLKYIFFTEWKCLHYSKSPTCLFWKMYILYVLTITLRFDTNTGRLLSHVTNSHWLLPLNYHFLQLFFYSLFSLSSLVHWNAYWRKPKRSAWRWSGKKFFRETTPDNALRPRALNISVTIAGICTARHFRRRQKLIIDLHKYTLSLFSRQGQGKLPYITCRLKIRNCWT